MRLVKVLANLGYGSRKEMQQAIRNGWVTDMQGAPIKADSQLPHEEILFDDEPLDPAQGSVLLLNKPLGVTCSKKDPGKLVYDLFPDRFKLRKPAISTIGRLDKETSGLLLLTDDGQYLHKVISPKTETPKFYEVTLDRPLSGTEATLFASGTMMLEGEDKPLKQAELTITGEHTATLVLHEGRYHQVRRMFAATGNHVTDLHRSRIGNLTLGDLKPGEWKVLSEDEKALVIG
ncbi:pseudouridine synthase [Pseudovibrio exalbescens]|uniref:pseudouridine synthase n=1 Tax=Pseudovibrio exalbescens TaxID=197461 RepID=UPI00236541F8|nr:pseudouridine synthase [Pseudovibrio exalbescens]MDD7909243.1 pseudouridine synthase [Pseudovibrio exalbescens]